MISQSKVFYNQNYKKRLEEKKMILDLTNVPFTRRNSYMVISYITDQFRLFGRKIAEDEGLYLRSVRGDCRMNPLIAHLAVSYTHLDAADE